MNPPSSLSSTAHELFSASLGQTRASVPRVLLHMEMRSVVRGFSLPVFSWPIWSDRQRGEVGGFQSYPGRPHPLVVALHKHRKQSLSNGGSSCLPQGSRLYLQLLPPSSSLGNPCPSYASQDGFLSHIPLD